jgi:hypothetical protein
MTLRLFTHPSAWIPIVMGMAGAASVFAYVALGGTGQPDGDEGLPARIFQLSMVAWVLLVGWFAARWLPRAPGQAILVLAVQAASAASALGVLYYFETIAAR